MAFRHLIFSLVNIVKPKSNNRSDSRIECEEWYNPAYTQQCYTCGKFFTLPPRDTLRVIKKECYDTGKLPYQTLKMAIEELKGDEIAEPRARLEAWWAYNELYNDAIEISIEEQEYNQANMKWLVAYHTPRATRFSYLLFELNRMLGNKELCEQMIVALTYNEFVRQKEIYYKENKIVFYDDEETLKRRYEREMKELKFALTQPQKAFLQDEVKPYEK